MPANKSGGSTSEPGEQASLKIQTHKACELAFYKLATEPGVRLAFEIRALLCPSCSHKLMELLTTVGLGAKNDHAASNLPHESP